MNFLKRFENKFLFDTYGAIASASFLVCLFSGVFLAIPFDVSDPYDSISYFVLTSPGSVLFRNMHYWSAQAFLVFTILHFWEHLYRGTEVQVKKGIWLRLVISIFSMSRPIFSKRDMISPITFSLTPSGLTMTRLF